MKKESKIQWTNITWNPFYGCKKVSKECKYCYMYRDQMRYGRNPTDVVKSKTQFDMPLKIINQGTLVFTCSWSDWFIEDADQWREELWKIIKACPHLTFQILTKRPERIATCLPDDWGSGYENVWLGVSVGENATIGRIETLNKVPSKIKFVSIEPLLEDITEFKSVLEKCKIDWCIIGGESGNDSGKFLYRPCEINWMKRIIHTCKEHKVKIFVKQLGTYLAKQLELKDRHGGDINEWPKELRIREIPKVNTNQIIMKHMKTTKKNKEIKNELTPFKKKIADALHSGKTHEEVAEHISKERKMPIRTAKAFVTMVTNHKKKSGEFLMEETPTRRREPGLHLSPFKKVLAHALIDGEPPDELAIRIANERNIPEVTAKAYVTMAWKIFNEKLINSK